MTIQLTQSPPFAGSGKELLIFDIKMAMMLRATRDASKMEYNETDDKLQFVRATNTKIKKECSCKTKNLHKI